MASSDKGFIVGCPMDIQDLRSIRDYSYPDWIELQNKAAENEGFRIAQNWTAQQKAKFAGKRLPYSMPVVADKLASLGAEQRKARTIFNVSSEHDVLDEYEAFIATAVLNDVTKNYQEIESDMFDEGNFLMLGANKIYVDKSGLFDRVSIKKIPYNRIGWDFKNTFEYDLSDSMFMWDVDYVSREAFQRITGIDVRQVSSGPDKFIGLDVPIMNITGKPEHDFISVFNHSQKVTREYWNVIYPNHYGFHQDLPDFVIIEKFRTRKEAEMRLRELNSPNVLANMNFAGTIIQTFETKIDLYKYCSEGILEYEETNISEHPHNVYFPIFLNGKFCSIMDFMKDPQRFLDRNFMTLDYKQNRENKQVVEYNPALLAESQTTAHVMSVLENGGVLLNKLPAGQSAIKELQFPRNTGQYVENIQMINSLINELMGGVEYNSGTSQYSGEPAKAVELKMAQGSATNSIYLRNLHRTKLSMGKKLLEWIREYESSVRTVKVFGQQISDNVLKTLVNKDMFEILGRETGKVKIDMNSFRLSFLDDSDYELQVKEDEFSESTKEKEMNKILLASKFNPQLMGTQVGLTKVMRGLGFTTEEIQSALQEIYANSQAESQMKREDLNVRKAKVLSAYLGKRNKDSNPQVELPAIMQQLNEGNQNATS